MAQVALSAWMTAVLFLYVLLYTPQPVWLIAEKAGFRSSLEDLQQQIKPFFQTEDFSSRMEHR